MLYVGASDVARRANAKHYPEFVEIAEHRLDDFKNQIDRFIGDFDRNFLEQIRIIERRQIWIFNKLRTGPVPAKDVARYFHIMRNISEQIHTLCCSSSISSYHEAIEKITKIGDEVWISLRKPSGMTSLDTLFRARLAVQSIFLRKAQEGQEFKILSIADDMDQSFALAYFIVDRWLMQHVVSDEE